MSDAVEGVSKDISDWYKKFESDVEENIALDAENRENRLSIVKNDLDRLIHGSLPMSRIFDTIRAHVVVRLGYQDKRLNDEVIRNLEITVEHQKIGRNYLLLYCVHTFLNNADAAKSILQYVSLP